MTILRRILISFVAVATASVLLAACGGGIPSGAVAVIDGSPISMAAFNHWIVIANDASSPTTPGAAPPPLPDPPNFIHCIAAGQAKQATLPKKAPKPTPTQLRAQCQSQYAQLRDQVMQFLISGDWLQGEAGDQGINVTAAQVKSQFNTERQQQFPTAAQFNNFIRSSGQTMTDLLYRVRLNLLSQKIQAKITGPTNAAGAISAAQVQQYFKQNSARLGTPQKRDIRVILLGSQATAQNVLAQIHGGLPVAAAAARFSTDQTTKSAGGAETGVVPGQLPLALDSAVFAAKVGVIGGPIKTTLGFFIFQVQKITPGVTPKLTPALTAQLKMEIAQQTSQKKMTAFVTSFQNKWKSRTNCLAAYATQQCSNPPKTTPTGVSAAVGG